MDEKQNQTTEIAQDIQTLSQQVKKFNIKDVLVPILSVVILIILTIFVYIPTLTSASDNVKEIKEIESNIETLEELKNNLDRINILDMQTDLSDAKDVIPYSLQVSTFVYYIDSLAKDHNLVFKDIFAGDIRTSSNGFLGDNTNINGVSGPLRYSGDLDNITAFLNGLQSSSPFIVSTDSIEVKKVEETDEWSVSLSVTGYYIVQGSYDYVNLYSPFLPYNRYEEVLEVFQDKAERLSDDTKDL